MKKKIITFWLIVLTFCFCFSGLTYAAEDTITASFPAVGGTTQYTVALDIDYDWFDAPSSTYNHQLAQATMGLVVAAFRDSKVDVTESDHNILTLYETSGFTDAETYGYHSEPTKTSIANTLAVRKLEDEEGEYILLAVPICGQGYKDEWMSNFQMGNGVEHEGFASAADQVYQRILDYLERKFPEERVKVWVCGFSRAAAVSNIVGARLLEDDRFEDNDIFVYTYATPNTTRDPIAYPQINNICGGFDPVPHVGLYDWGYSKYGITHYLPDRARTTDYDNLAKSAREQYAALTGDASKFDSLTARNWLVMKVLQILEELIPEPRDYTGAVQDAVIAAWGAQGEALQKLSVFAEELMKKQIQGEELPMDEQSISNFTSEILTLMSLPVVDTYQTLEGQGGSSVWYEILSSGSRVLYEHFPDVYLSWMLSSDDPDTLFESELSYHRIIYTGDVETRILAIDAENGEETVLMDTENGITGALDALMVQNQAFINLPDGVIYRIQLKVKPEKTETQVGYGFTSVKQEAVDYSTTNLMTLYQGETLDLEIIELEDGKNSIQVLLNGNEWIPLRDEENGRLTNDLLMEGGTSNQALESILSQGLVMVPYALFAAILLIYALTVLIKRMIRHKVEDDAPCRLPGKILLICSLLMSLSMCIEPVLSITSKLTGITVATPISNHTLKRASEWMNMGSITFYSIVLVYYGMLSVLNYRSIHHYLSRIRLIRLSILILLLNTITIFLGVSQNTLQINDFFTQIVPISSITGVILSTVRSDQDRKVGKRWLPVSRAIIATLLLFLIRQVCYYLLGAEDGFTVFLKSLTGLPVLILALHIVKIRKKQKYVLTALAMLLYLAANGVINVSLTLGILLFVAGHITLFVAFYKVQKPGKKQWIAGSVTAVIFIGELIALRNYIPTELMIFGSFYVLVLAGLIAVAFPINKRLRMGMILFALANQMLVFTFIIKGNFLFESTELLFYYMAQLVITADPAGLIDKVIPTAGWEYVPPKVQFKRLHLKRKHSSESKAAQQDTEIGQEEK